MIKIIEAIYDLLGEENRFFKLIWYFLILKIKIFFWIKRKGENSPPNRVNKIMEKLDKDRDGKLSSDEFVEGCLNDEILRHLLAPNTV
jgi:hypothetical protein